MTPLPSFPRQVFGRHAKGLATLLLASLFLGLIVRTLPVRRQLTEATKRAGETRDAIAYAKRQLETTQAPDLDTPRRALADAEARLKALGASAGPVAPKPIHERLAAISRMVEEAGLELRSHGAAPAGTARIEGATVRELEAFGSFAGATALIDRLATSPDLILILKTRIVRSEYGITVTLSYAL